MKMTWNQLLWARRVYGGGWTLAELKGGEKVTIYSLLRKGVLCASEDGELELTNLGHKILAKRLR